MFVFRVIADLENKKLIRTALEICSTLVLTLVTKEPSWLTWAQAFVHVRGWNPLICFFSFYLAPHPAICPKPNYNISGNNLVNMRVCLFFGLFATNGTLHVQFYTITHGTCPTSPPAEMLQRWEVMGQWQALTFPVQIFPEVSNGRPSSIRPFLPTLVPLSPMERGFFR